MLSIFINANLSFFRWKIEFTEFPHHFFFFLISDNYNRDIFHCNFYHTFTHSYFIYFFFHIFTTGKNLTMPNILKLNNFFKLMRFSLMKDDRHLEIKKLMK